VLLIPPVNKAELKPSLLPGVNPVPPATGGADTAKGVTLPAKPEIKAPPKPELKTEPKSGAKASPPAAKAP
jgi:hypothetical protein